MLLALATSLSTVRNSGQWSLHSGVVYQCLQAVPNGAMNLARSDKFKPRSIVVDLKQNVGGTVGLFVNQDKSIVAMPIL